MVQVVYTSDQNSIHTLRDSLWVRQTVDCILLFMVAFSYTLRICPHCLRRHFPPRIRRILGIRLCYPLLLHVSCHLDLRLRHIRVCVPTLRALTARHFHLFFGFHQINCNWGGRKLDWILLWLLWDCWFGFRFLAFDTMKLPEMLEKN